jgi:hypothetical protein
MVAHYADTTTRSGSGVAARIVLTLLGAAGLIVGGLLQWWDDMVGTELTVKALYQTTFTETDQFVTSVGAVAILLGLIAVLGLVAPSGWLTRLAGALGVVMFIMFAVQAYRATSSVDAVLDHLGAGAWVVLGGGLVALVGGFLGRPRMLTGATRVRDENI